MKTTVPQRILLHLREYVGKPGPREECTQRGIAHAIGARVGHVPRALRRLMALGLVREFSGRPPGVGRAVKCYALTEEGAREARSLWENFAKLQVFVRGESMALADGARAAGLTPAAAVALLREDGTLTVGYALPPDFVDRHEELRVLEAWLRGPAPCLVVYGLRGFGKTALARAFVRGLRRPVRWVDLGDDGNLGRALGAAGLPADARDLSEALRRDAALLVVDGYGEVSESTVEFLSGLVEAAGDPPSKVLVLAQETTPSYCRFYGRRETDRGHVAELHLRGLDDEASGILLGVPDIDPEASRRIFLLTKGSPMLLRLVREGDEQGLRQASKFTPAEIKLLLFSRNLRARRS